MKGRQHFTARDKLDEAEEGEVRPGETDSGRILR